MQTLHGYTVDETQWKSKGGGGQCNIAKKGGKEYFIKRLAFPRYPDSDNFKGAFKQQKIDICNDWYRRRQEIIRAIPGSGTGTTVKPIEYFREGPCYYEVANLIDVTSIPYDEIYKESKEDKARVMLTVAMSLADLHKKGIVHGDLDPRNILISRVAGSKNLVTLKMILRKRLCLKTFGGVLKLHFIQRLQHRVFHRIHTKNIFLVRLTYSHWELYSISIVRRVASHLSARKHSLGKSLIQERLHRLLQKLNQSSEP